MKYFMVLCCIVFPVVANSVWAPGWAGTNHAAAFAGTCSVTGKNAVVVDLLLWCSDSLVDSMLSIFIAGCCVA